MIKWLSRSGRNGAVTQSGPHRKQPNLTQALDVNSTEKKKKTLNMKTNTSIVVWSNATQQPLSHLRYIHIAPR